ncbi:MAG: PEGA domain-containing protein [Candidatus Sericytochromatia bacterium]|nr:PEGA domain-containing protein [Candidatus Sericytochromatia bacterium]
MSKRTISFFRTLCVCLMVFSFALPAPALARIAQPAAPQAPVGIQQPVSLAVLELAPRGADPVLTAAFSDLLRIHLRDQAGVRLLERVRMDDILKEQHFQLSTHCGDSESCLQETGRMLGVQRLVLGAVHQIDGFFSAHLHLLDVASAQMTGAATFQCKCSVEEMLTRVPQALAAQLTDAIYAEMPTGQLRIDSTPSGAEVVLNQQLMGRTPLHLPQVIAGEHTLLLRQANYQVNQQKIQVKPSQVAAFNLALLEERRGGSLNVHITPPGAQVAINGKSHGPAPLVLDALPPGLHQVTVSHPDYHSQLHTVMVAAGQVKNFETRLLPKKKPRGTLYLDLVPSRASVYVNGVYQGHTPVMLMLDAEPQQLTLRRPGYARWEQQVKVDPAQSLRLNPRLEKDENAWILPSVIFGSVAVLLAHLFMSAERQ